MTEDIVSELEEKEPCTVTKGNLNQIQARLDDGRVRVTRQKRMHSFNRGFEDKYPEIPIWSGSIQTAVRLHSILDDLLYGCTDEEPEK